MFQAFLKNSDRAVQDATYQHNRNSMTTHLEEVLSNSLDTDLLQSNLVSINAFELKFKNRITIFELKFRSFSC